MATQSLTERWEFMILMFAWMSTLRAIMLPSFWRWERIAGHKPKLRFLPLGFLKPLYVNTSLCKKSKFRKLIIQHHKWKVKIETFKSGLSLILDTNSGIEQEFSGGWNKRRKQEQCQLEYWKESNIQSINDVINVAGHVIVIYFISEF